jgi:hypothetical protein
MHTIVTKIAAAHQLSEERRPPSRRAVPGAELGFRIP